MTGEAPAGTDQGAVAEARSLGRIRAVAWMLAAVGGGTLALASGGRAAIVLTAVAAASIVALRGLERAVAHLRVGPEGELSPGSAAPLFLRLALWAVAVVAALLLGSPDVMAILLGASVVPLAVIVEAGLQLVALSRPKDR